MTKRDRLVALKRKMKSDEALPLGETATNLVFGEGSADADIFFLGEAPGFWEDQKARPFVGRAGQLLDSSLKSIGLERRNVFITNVVNFRPPENRDPTEEEIAAFEPYINSMIKIIKPKIIVTLGRFSMGKFMPGERISQIHGQPRNVKWNGVELLVYPLYHPAAALRNGAVREEFDKDFRKLANLLE